MSGKKPKRSSKNLKINTRIVLTTVLAIAIPLVLVALVFVYTRYTAMPVKLNMRLPLSCNATYARSVVPSLFTMGA